MGGEEGKLGGWVYCTTARQLFFSGRNQSHTEESPNIVELFFSVLHPPLRFPWEHFRIRRAKLPVLGLCLDFVGEVA